MHARTLSQHAQESLAALGKSQILVDAYLAGGSALALQLGHRKSYDFDFYTPKNILAKDVAAQLATIGPFTTILLEPPHTILGEFKGVKFSLFRYAYPLLEKPQLFLNVSIASVLDIAAMKLSAICGRATKRDYVDLYIISKHHSFEELFSWYEKKFGPLGNNLYVIIRALGYFEDAEADAMPEMLIPVVWDDVKAFFNTESMRLGKKYLEG